MTYKKRVMYGKIGRTITIDPAKWGAVGGDNEAPTMLLTLADKHPDVEWLVIAKNQGWAAPRPNITNMWADEGLQAVVREASRSLPEDPKPILEVYDREIMPMFDDSIDEILVWLGQHGSVASLIPSISGPNKGELTQPLMSLVIYVSYIVRGINYWKREERYRTREEVWLNPDTRNYLKCRDLKWPLTHPVLGQFNETKQHRVYRYGDPRTPQETGFGHLIKPDSLYPDVWTYKAETVYAGLELAGVPIYPLDDMTPFEDRDNDLGLIMNENRVSSPEKGRLKYLTTWAMPLGDRFSYVHGQWSANAVKTLGFEPQPIEHDAMYELQSRTKCTLTTMASSSGYATAKPWEAASQGVICFFAPGYDSQGHVIPTTEQISRGTVDPKYSDNDIALAQWLRCDTAEQFAKRVEAVSTSRETYEWLRNAQHDLFYRRKNEEQIYTAIAERLGL